MPIDPPADLALTPLHGRARTVQEWLTTFHLALVVLDPYTNESAWILPTASRILREFAQADCRTAWLVTAEADDTRAFLGPLADELLAFCDPDRVAVRALGLDRLPAFLHLDMAGHVVGSAEGWDPPAWKAVADELADLMSWATLLVPAPRDPAPFAGTPAAG
ncbi:MAG: hypothetical protein IPM45_13800 [Acidimicrobiales bacterium]|nr:hypothetical protein [Acidimicrobiales bacterium]